ncbi:hypothetical protein GLOTRDRAFT_125805 [Gloeophyllum trabeum ATCC 11539]|uniref:PUB domain-containing protein n=1 Tax=Gloeophyllum trabeum (strain ATCC 11539 / FP-39264 / Madison 617) TaxID=670483 RepID=S7QJL4_GLOTA|nr:uncharacterized protein GLOTRDRAFT_125805 [Gloeophyllum trabeum ATCC 11539]EPQ59497.1 hypothetical protein GLOTRDRAFT_125805 [Gloeophyllum trabeum ATCC 11539]
MSSGNVSPAGSPGPSVRESIAAAAARRTQQKAALHAEEQHRREHDKRQEFRRLIEPGIFTRNPDEVSMVALRTLSTIADNLLREPNNSKFQRFKPTNSTIKERLIDPKGALEYAIALGFRTEVEEFQPYYVFNPRHMDDLRIGAAIIHEVLDRKAEQQERMKRWKEQEKVAAASVAQNVKLAFMDDRKSKLLNDKREKELREARATAAASRQSMSPPASPSTSAVRMTGPGRTLSGAIVHGDDLDIPPPYPRRGSDDGSEMD